jgi:hypothetical protein
MKTLRVEREKYLASSRAKGVGVQGVGRHLKDPALYLRSCRGFFRFSISPVCVRNFSAASGANAVLIQREMQGRVRPESVLKSALLNNGILSMIECTSP